MLIFLRVWWDWKYALTFSNLLCNVPDLRARLCRILCSPNEVRAAPTTTTIATTSSRENFNALVFIIESAKGKLIMEKGIYIFRAFYNAVRLYYIQLYISFQEPRNVWKSTTSSRENFNALVFIIESGKGKLIMEKVWCDAKKKAFTFFGPFITLFLVVYVNFTSASSFQGHRKVYKSGGWGVMWWA